MHWNESQPKEAAYQLGQFAGSGMVGTQIQENPRNFSVRENLERQISFHESEAKRLKAVLEEISTKPLIEVKLGTLHDAMRF